jgi:hypothetical protein
VDIVRWKKGESQGRQIRDGKLSRVHFQRAERPSEREEKEPSAPSLSPIFLPPTTIPNHCSAAFGRSFGRNSSWLPESKILCPSHAVSRVSSCISDFLSVPEFVSLSCLSLKDERFGCVNGPSGELARERFSSLESDAMRTRERQDPHSKGRGLH